MARRHSPKALCRRWPILIALVVICVGYIPSQARGPLQRERVMGGVRLYYAPQYDLAEIDQALLASAKRRIDIAAYVLTDRGIMQSLIMAAKRGVRIRIYLNPDHGAARGGAWSSNLSMLIGTKGIDVRVKTDGRDLMHLKSYHVDGKVLRTGAANFSYSGMRRQDNDLLIIESEQIAGQFAARFDFLWNRPGSRPFSEFLR